MICMGYGKSFCKTGGVFGVQTYHKVEHKECFCECCDSLEASEDLEDRKMQKNTFQTKIHHFTERRLPASYSLPGIAYVIEEKFRVNKILLNEMKAPKTQLQLV